MNSHSMTNTATALQPRKTPIQARSAATVAALHTATIQVLMQEGLSRCTTTRVAERAGMSVGSLYQYYPNRDALLAAVLEEHLVGIGAAVERACRAARGWPVAEMAAVLVGAYLGAKLSDPAKSKALYSVAAERGGRELARQMYARSTTAIADMLESAPDGGFTDPLVTAAIALTAIAGPVTALLEGLAPPGFETRLEEELVGLLTAYFRYGG
jgi:AcrR family transcriptional regulator